MVDSVKAQQSGEQADVRERECVHVSICARARCVRGAEEAVRGEVCVYAVQTGEERGDGRLVSLLRGCESTPTQSKSSREAGREGRDVGAGVRKTRKKLVGWWEDFQAVEARRAVENPHLQA